MTRQDLNLGFLYEEKKGVYIDKEHPFDKKWDNEYLKFSEYLKNSTIDNYFELMINAHRDVYPRDYWVGGTILKRGYSPDSDKLEGEYTVLDGSLFVYPELEQVKLFEKKDEDGFDYTYEYVYEFKEALELKQIVEKSLEGKDYTKEEGIETSYIVNNSPINTIILGKDYLKFTINEDFYKHRML